MLYSCAVAAVRPIGALLALALACSLPACGPSEFQFDPGLEGLEILSVDPGMIVPGSVVVVQGRSFVDTLYGDTTLHLAGEGVDLSFPARFIDYGRLEVDADSVMIDTMQDFTGKAWIEVASKVDGQVHESNSVTVSMQARIELLPELETITSDEVIFVNDQIVVEGEGIYLRSTEGYTIASVKGCFRTKGSSECVRVPDGDVEVKPASEFDRTRGSFAFRPSIAGIQAGTFEGTVLLRNEPIVGRQRESAARPVSYEITEPTVFSIVPAKASLGQYVTIEGGGFLGGEDLGLTLIELTGTFYPDGAEIAVPIEPPLVLVPEFVSGRLIRYALNEDDELADRIDLRRVTGRFEGEVNVITSYHGDEVRSDSGPAQFSIEPVRQVVYLNFRPSYVESLRHFGLRAMDRYVRQRILDVVARDYATLNVDVRTELPQDFGVYMEVELAGPDVNQLGLLGYDNTPGKDTGNDRLHDKIGGVNWQTQEDGFPGYGGVFIESLFAFSRHPGTNAAEVTAADPVFDQLFDPFRPDQDGKPVSAADLGGGFHPLTAGSNCPARTRPEQIQCAVWVLGSLIGTTLTHEMGHAFGLANPFGDGFHNLLDGQNRLMDAGGDRPFSERAEIFGDGPARFCDDEYDYLRQILPTDEPNDPMPRPGCF